jgi:hypothetical protein
VQSTGFFTLRMCQQNSFEIFNQVPSLIWQKMIEAHILRNNWRFLLKLAPNIHLPAHARHFRTEHNHAVHAHAHALVNQTNVMHANAMRCLFYLTINGAMPTVAIGPKPI